MSDTPRTDVEELTSAIQPLDSYVYSSFARQLERELNEAKRDLAQQVDTNCQREICIERLREQIASNEDQL